jgi:hypothetical protein
MDSSRFIRTNLFRAGTACGAQVISATDQIGLLVPAAAYFRQNGESACVRLAVLCTVCNYGFAALGPGFFIMEVMDV